MALEFDDIPMVLVSNSSLNVYPENTISNFKNNLHTAIELPNDREWFVGVSEISYTKSWMQLPEDQEISIVRHYLKEATPGIFVNTNQIEIIQLPSLAPAYYDSIGQVVKAVNDVFLKKATCKLEMNGSGNAVRVTSNRGTTNKSGKSLLDDGSQSAETEKIKFFDVPLFSQELTYFLGLHLTYAKLFNSNQFTGDTSNQLNIIYTHDDATSNDLEFSLLQNRKAKHRKIADSHAYSFKIHSDSSPMSVPSRSQRSLTDKDITLYSELFSSHQSAKPSLTLSSFPILGQPIDIMNGAHSLFVYCDICQTSRVGDSLTQLLTIVDVPMNAKYGEQIYRRFEVPQFQKVSRNYITDIEIDIRDDTGAAIPFVFGRVIMKIVFRSLKRADKLIQTSVE